MERDSRSFLNLKKKKKKKEKPAISMQANKLHLKFNLNSI